MNINICFFVISFGMLFHGTMKASPTVEELFANYYRDNGSDLYNGHANLLVQTYNPYISKETLMNFNSNENQTEEDKKKQEIYFRYVQDRYSVNLLQGKPETKYEAMRVWFQGEKKKKDYLSLGVENYENILQDTSGFEHLKFNRYFENDGKSYAINDIGKMASDPQVVVSNGRISFPKIKFTKSPLNDQQYEIVIKMLMSDKYIMSGSVTDEGYLAIAEKVDNHVNMNRVELLFDQNNNYNIKRAVTYYDGLKFTEEIFKDYIVTSSGESIPTKIINRRFVPVFGTVDEKLNEEIPLMVSIEQVMTVLEADYNIDIPDDMFIPVFPYGATVLDTTVKPFLEFTAGLVKTDSEKDFFDESIEDVKKIKVENQIGLEKDLSPSPKPVVQQNSLVKKEISSANAGLAESSNSADKLHTHILSVLIFLFLVLCVLIVVLVSRKLFSKS